jgi:hypothetical protein
VTVALSLEVKQPGCEADHSPPPSAEVKECVELYCHSPIRLHDVVLSEAQGQLYLNVIIGPTTYIYRAADSLEIRTNTTLAYEIQIWPKFLHSRHYGYSALRSNSAINNISNSKVNRFTALLDSFYSRGNRGSFPWGTAAGA